MNCVTPFWQIITITLGSMGVGILTGAALFYPIGRRHGISVMCTHWRKAMREDQFNKFASSGIRGTPAPKDRRP